MNRNVINYLLHTITKLLARQICLVRPISSRSTSPLCHPITSHLLAKAIEGRGTFSDENCLSTAKSNNDSTKIPTRSVGNYSECRTPIANRSAVRTLCTPYVKVLGGRVSTLKRWLGWANTGEQRSGIGIFYGVLQVLVAYLDRRVKVFQT